MENTWHKINLSKEQVAGGVLSALRDKFNSIYNVHGKPKGFACFFKAKNVQSPHTIYISPLAFIKCEFIINDYGATECDPPDYSSMGLLSGNDAFCL